jgi:hypothetical protein
MQYYGLFFNMTFRDTTYIRVMIINVEMYNVIFIKYLKDWETTLWARDVEAIFKHKSWSKWAWSTEDVYLM